MITDELLRYNALDSAVTFEVAEKIWNGLDDGYQWTYDLTQRIMGPLSYMMYRGILVNTEALATTKEEVEQQIGEKQEQLNQLVGRCLNPQSPKDCQQYFYGELGITPYTKTNDKGKTVLTTDDKAMQRLAKGTSARQPIPAARLVQELRGLHKLRGTYLEIEFDSDGRFRCAVNPRGTVTGRISTSKTIYGTGMNMQNLPVRFKRFLISDPGLVLIEVDKAGAEWVVVAYISGDPRMMQIVEEGKDPHTATAHLMFGLPEDLIKYENKLIGHETDPAEIENIRKRLPEIQKATFVPRNMSLRQAGKKANHGLNYDEGYKTFALMNEIPEFEAKKMVELYHQAYPNIRNIWYNRVQDRMRTDRTLTNYFGRKRRFYNKLGDSLYKAAYAQEPQSTVSDNLNLGMCEIYESDEMSVAPLEMLAQVHDSVLSQYPDDDLGLLAECIAYQKMCMDKTITLNGRTFTIGTDIKVGYNWADMEEVPFSTDQQELVDNLKKVLQDARGS